MKPDLSLYKGRKVVGILQDEEISSDWGIELEGGVVIQNVKATETFAPTPEIIGCILETVLLSLHDTKLVLRAANGHMHMVSFAPTYYTISDPGYGGIVYPQWPEELEQGGVPATPEGGISDEPGPGWNEAEKELHARAQARREQEAAAFMKEDDDGSSD